jgi:serine/threonine protein kinase
MGLTDNSEIRLIRRQKRKNILREIFFYKNLVVKRFVKLKAFPDVRRVWEMEDRALKRLEGLAFPKSLGFKEKIFQGVKEIIYAREYIEGTPVQRFDASDVGELADLMTKIHHRGVITCDPAPDNFLRLASGKLMFIDFGRSKIVNPRGPIFLYRLGKELARIQGRAFFNDRALFSKFLHHYSRLIELSPNQWKCVNLIYSIWARHWWIRHKRRNGLNHSASRHPPQLYSGK